MNLNLSPILGKIRRNLRTVSYVIALLVMIRIAYHEQDEDQATSFCEKLARVIEKSIVPSSKFPEKLDSAWLKGAPLPSFIDANSLYQPYRNGECFLLRFRNSAELYRDVHEYRSCDHAWVRYDSE